MIGVMKNSIYPCLWFDGNAEEAASLYCSAFSDARMDVCTPLVCTFYIKNKQFMGLNGGGAFKPNPSISFFTVCETEDEVNHAWELLADGGDVLMPLGSYAWSTKYGWVQDKYGVSWQITLRNKEIDEPDIFPSLMFIGEQNGNAEKAINFYTSLFQNSTVDLVAKYEPGDHDIEGNVKFSQFHLDGLLMGAMDSSIPHDFSFNQGISLVISCNTQEEIDFYWLNLTEGGKEERCGWCQDSFGVWWQVVPSILSSLMNDPTKATKVTEAFLKMKKFDIVELEKAARSN